LQCSIGVIIGVEIRLTVKAFLDKIVIFHSLPRCCNIRHRHSRLADLTYC
jgi:hypothetical protein